jgi:hypothetical protein
MAEESGRKPRKYPPSRRRQVALRRNISAVSSEAKLFCIPSKHTTTSKLLPSLST